MGINKTVIITGANGFIGQTLSLHFKKKGWRVVALMRNPNPNNVLGVEQVRYDLTKPINETIFKNANYLIHCAYISYGREKKKAFELNISGTKQLLEVSRKYGLKKNIFLSSMSAQPDALSNYGKQKFAIEQLFNTNKDVVVRPGLVLGNGGLVKKMTGFIKTKKIVPLIGGGQQPLQTVHVNELAIAIEKIIEKDLNGTFTIAEPASVTYEDFYSSLCSVLKINILFIPVSYTLAKTAIGILNILRLNNEISTESLMGLKNLNFVDTKNDLNNIGVSISDYKKSLEKLFGN